MALRGEIEAARELFQGGRAALARSEFRALQARLDRLDDKRAEVVAEQARLLLGLALAEFEVTGDFDEAMSLYDRAERAVAESGAYALTATIHGQRALLHHRRGENLAALSEFDEAVLSFDAAPVYDQMTILLNRSALHLDRGELDEASDDLQTVHRPRRRRR